MTRQEITPITISITRGKGNLLHLHCRAPSGANLVGAERAEADCISNVGAVGKGRARRFLGSVRMETDGMPSPYFVDILDEDGRTVLARNIAMVEV